MKAQSSFLSFFGWCFATVAFLLVSCVGSGGTATGPKADTLRVGWEGAGFWPPAAAIKDSGASPQLIKYVDGHLVVQDMYTLVNGTQSYRLFERALGNANWDSIALPTGVSFDIGWMVDSPYVYLGAAYQAKLFRYNIQQNEWKELPISLADSVQTGRGWFPKQPDAPYWVPFVLKYHDSLMVSIAAFGNSVALQLPRLNIWGMMEGGVWKGVLDSLNETDNFADVQEFHSKLYGATYMSGVFRLSSQRIWQKLPPPDYIVFQGDSSALGRSRSLEVMGDNLYVAYLGGAVYRWNETAQSWTNIAQCDSGRICYPKPYDNIALTHYKDRLIAAGISMPIPVWYNDTTGQWNYLSRETWQAAFPSKNDYTGPTYDMVVVGDTLYVAHERGILKLDLADSAVWTADTTDTRLEIVNP